MPQTVYCHRQCSHYRRRELRAQTPVGAGPRGALTARKLTIRPGRRSRGGGDAEAMAGIEMEEIEHGKRRAMLIADVTGWARVVTPEAQDLTREDSREARRA